MGKTCTAVHLNYVGRHGSRLTGDDDILGYTKLWEEIKSHRDNTNNFTFIATWENRYPVENASRLTNLGRQELFYLGRNYGKGLKTLLENGIEDSNILATRKIRTQTSAVEFFAGLTDSVTGQQWRNRTPDVRNDLLRSYDGCEKYETEVDDNDAIRKEMYDFQKGSRYQKCTVNSREQIGIEH